MLFQYFPNWVFLLSLVLIAAAVVEAVILIAVASALAAVVEVAIIVAVLFCPLLYSLN